MFILTIAIIVVWMALYTLVKIPFQPHWGTALMGKLFLQNRHHSFFYWYPFLYSLILLCEISIIVLAAIQGCLALVAIFLLLTIPCTRRLIKSIITVIDTNQIKFK